MTLTARTIEVLLDQVRALAGRDSLPPGLETELMQRVESAAARVVAWAPQLAADDLRVRREARFVLAGLRAELASLLDATIEDLVEGGARKLLREIAPSVVALLTGGAGGLLAALTQVLIPAKEPPP